jgi:hypothetical protein
MARKARRGSSAVERVIAAPKLQSLLTTSKAADHRASEERGRAAAKSKAAVESDYLDQRAFAVVKRVSKLDSHLQVITLRNIQLYADLVEVGTQMDIEDAIAAKEEEDRGSNRASPGEQYDIEGDEAGEVGEAGEEIEEVAAEPTEKVRSGRRKERVLAQFSEALSEATDMEGVSGGLDNFVADHPEFEEEAIGLARARLKAISEAQSGGEDLRPPGNTEAGKLDAAQEEREVEKKPRGRPRKPRPESPAAQAAADLGFGR